MKSPDNHNWRARNESHRHRRSRNIALALLLLALVALFYALTVVRISETIDHGQPPMIVR